MRRDFIDFHLVPHEQLVMHGRLLNWARYVKHKFPVHIAPIWRLGKSNARQWEAPEPEVPVDTLDGHAIEKAVCQLPEKHRMALKWHYVLRTDPAHARKILGLTNDGLQRHVNDARTMLHNRGV